MTAVLLDSGCKLQRHEGASAASGTREEDPADSYGEQTAETWCRSGAMEIPPFPAESIVWIPLELPRKLPNGFGDFEHDATDPTSVSRWQTSIRSISYFSRRYFLTRQPHLHSDRQWIRETPTFPSPSTDGWYPSLSRRGRRSRSGW